jgi:hypothetical protein
MTCYDSKIEGWQVVGRFVAQFVGRFSLIRRRISYPSWRFPCATYSDQDRIALLDADCGVRLTDYLNTNRLKRAAQTFFG